MISEVFCEFDYDDAAIARQHRETRLLELEAQGMICTREDLYRVDGRRVFLLTATPSTKERLIDDPVSSTSPSRPRPRGERSPRPTPKFETR
jgi:hypothetical protein